MIEQSSQLSLLRVASADALSMSSENYVRLARAMSDKAVADADIDGLQRIAGLVWQRYDGEVVLRAEQLSNILDLHLYLGLLEDALIAGTDISSDQFLMKYRDSLVT